MKHIFYFLFVVSLFTSCASEDGVEVVKFQEKYSLTVPTFLTKVNNLNDDASLQYQHAFKEFYLIVIDEAKSEFENALDIYDLNGSYSQDLSGYSNLVLENFSGYSKSDIQDVFINNLPAKTFTWEENIDGIDVYYAVAIVEGKENYYQIMTWTLANRKLRYKDRMNQILNSFNEL